MHTAWCRHAPGTTLWAGSAGGWRPRPVARAPGNTPLEVLGTVALCPFYFCLFLLLSHRFPPSHRNSQVPASPEQGGARAPPGRHSGPGPGALAHASAWTIGPAGTSPLPGPAVPRGHFRKNPGEHLGKSPAWGPPCPLRKAAAAQPGRVRKLRTGPLTSALLRPPG